MHHYAKRLLALFLALLFCLSLFPAAALAEDTEEPAAPAEDGVPGEGPGEDDPPAEGELPEITAEDPASLDEGADPAALPPAEDETEEAASGACGDDLTWTLENGTLTISGSGDMWDWDRDEAPWYGLNSEITRIVIKTGVTSIGDHAFSDCGSLVNVSAGKSISRVGDEAFCQCTSLRALSFDSTAPSFGANVFSGVTACVCYPIADSSWTEEVIQNCGGSITLANQIIGESVYFTLDGNGLLTVFGSGETTDYGQMPPPFSVHLGEKVHSLVIEPGVTGIGNLLFYGCVNLTEASFPESVTRIGACAFQYCSSLTEVTIPGSVTSIGESPFPRCDSLTAILVAEDNSVYASQDGILYTEDMTTLIQCPGGKSGTVTIPGSVTSIGDWAFASCSDLGEIRFEGPAPSFGSDVFSGVTATAYYPADDPTWTEEIVGDGSFGGGTITWVPYDPVTSGACGDELTWTLENGVLTISGSGDMWDWDRGEAPWYGLNSGITQVVIEPGVTSIGDRAFYCCSLTSVTIPGSVTSIGGEAFFSCRSLTEVTIPESVTSIASGAFAYCSGLGEIRFEGPAPSFASSVFYCDTATAYYPADDPTWTEEIVGDESFGGGTITWVAYASPAYTPGDINGDGDVDNRDVTWLMRYVKYQDVSVTALALDVNGDGEVDNKDVTWLMRYVKYGDVTIH